MQGEEQGKRRREEEGKAPIELHSDLVLVICHFSMTSCRPALIQWSVQELDEVQALKLQTNHLHHVNLKTRLQILRFWWPVISTLFESVLEHEHGKKLWSVSAQMLFLAHMYRANRRTTYQYLHLKIRGYILHFSPQEAYRVLKGCKEVAETASAPKILCLTLHTVYMWLRAHMCPWATKTFRIAASSQKAFHPYMTTTTKACPRNDKSFRGLPWLLMPLSCSNVLLLWQVAPYGKLIMLLQYSNQKLPGPVLEEEFARVLGMV